MIGDCTKRFISSLILQVTHSYHLYIKSKNNVLKWKQFDFNFKYNKLKKLIQSVKTLKSWKKA